MEKLKEYFLFFFKGILFSLLSFAFFWYLINPYNANFKTAEVAVNTYALNVFVSWTFFGAFLLLRADEEWKKVDETITENNLKKFLIEGSKEMAASVKIVYYIISFLVVTSYYFFHYESGIIAFAVIFGTSFLVAIAVMVLMDLDNPIEGLINVPNIPKEWIEKLNQHKEKRKK